jgi:hypothetical protein
MLLIPRQAAYFLMCFHETRLCAELFPLSFGTCLCELESSEQGPLFPCPTEFVYFFPILSFFVFFLELKVPGSPGVLRCEGFTSVSLQC